MGVIRKVIKNRVDQRKSVLRAANLETLVKVICKLQVAPFTRNKFQSMYAQASHRRIKPKTTQDYFYISTETRLILPKSKSLYEINKSESKRICGYLDKNKWTEIKAHLLNVFKSKIGLFADFIDILHEKPRTIGELTDCAKVNIQSVRTMLGWAIWFGIVAQNRFTKEYYSIKERTEPLSKHALWKILKTVYEETRMTEFGAKGTFVKIPDLRENCCSILGIRRETFDEKFREILLDRAFSRKVELSGAPIVYLEEEKKKSKANLPFLFNGRKYYFLALTRNSGEM